MFEQIIPDNNIDEKLKENNEDHDVKAPKKVRGEQEKKAREA